MPMHDWSRVDPGVYHTFHQDWAIELCRTLNRGVLPAGYVATVDLPTDEPEPSHVIYQFPNTVFSATEHPPRAAFVGRADRRAAAYARKANRVVVRHGLGPVVAVIEVVSPGNKDSRHAVAAFRDKAVEFLTRGVSLVLVDPFPPGPRDPDGLPQLIWDELPGPPLGPRPAGLPLTAAGFDATDGVTAYVNPFAVGEPIPDAPLFLAPGWYVNVPLERTYAASWAETPQPLRELVEPAAG